MKTLMQRIPWCALMLLGCSSIPDGMPGDEAPAGGSASGVSGTPGSSGAAGTVAGVGGSGAGTGGAPAVPGVTCGAPPSVSLVSPVAAAQMTPGAVLLEASAANPTMGSSVTFYVRRAHDPDFTIAIMPDTQNYVVDPYNQTHFDKQTEWIMQNRDAANIVGVIHNGDLINRPEMAFEWDYAEQAMSKLEQPLPPAYPSGLPYIITIGNHDQEPMSNTGHADEFNRRFGVARFSGRPYYGGHYGERNDHSYITFVAGSQKFLVMALEYGVVPAAAQAWALEVIRAHPDHRVIMDVHELIKADGSWGVFGEQVYQLVKAEPNVELMTCGHHLGESRRSDTFEQHTVHTMFANWQHLDQGGLGRMRLWHFSPTSGTLLVRTYSPSFNEEFTADESRFTLPFDMSQAVPLFAPVAVLGDVSGPVTTMTGALDPGTQYEWYVEAKDPCGQVTASEVRTFSTL